VAHNEVTIGLIVSGSDDSGFMYIVSTSLSGGIDIEYDLSQNSLREHPKAHAYHLSNITSLECHPGSTIHQSEEYERK
jgi:hypothetical protein